MSIHVRNLVRVATSLRAANPELSKELLLNTRRLVGDSVRISVINPGVKTYEEYVKEIVTTLKDLKTDLSDALTELDDAEEFSEFFSDVFFEEEELKELLSNAKGLGKVSSRTSGFKDWFDGVVNFFKKDDTGDDSSTGVDSEYNLDEVAIDEFVEGSRAWNDASFYIEEEFKENKEFFSGVREAIAEVEKLRKSPSRELTKALIGELDKLIKFGERMLSGVRKHLSEPSAMIDLSEDEEAPKPQEDGASDIAWGLETTVDHYLEALQNALGNEKKTISLLKELFSKVSPSLKTATAQQLKVRREAQNKVLPAMIKLAYHKPDTRSVLLPIIKQAINI